MGNRRPSEWGGALVCKDLRPRAGDVRHRGFRRLTLVLPHPSFTYTPAAPPPSTGHLGGPCVYSVSRFAFSRNIFEHTEKGVLKVCKVFL